MRHCWIDGSAGVAGDMLLGALVDAGADLGTIQAAVDAVVPASVRIRPEVVTRAGQRSTRVHVDVLVDDPPHRTWASIKAILSGSSLDPVVRDRALAVFGRLADAEADVHGVPTETIHFHEVGAVDALADIVGVCAAIQSLSIESVTGGLVAVGSGRTWAAHGDLPVPVPAVTELAVGWEIHAGGTGELATPTGMALITTLANRCESLPPLRLDAIGVGAGSRDTPGRANVVRVLVGDLVGATSAGEDAVLLETNVDDLDPRLWPGVLESLLAAGASDAWLVPIVMKKGRPAHTLMTLAEPSRAPALRDLITAETSTFGVRSVRATKFPQQRGWTDVLLDGRPVPVKVAHDGRRVLRATPEFDDVAAHASATGRPTLDVLQESSALARAGGLVPGADLPPSLRPARRGTAFAEPREHHQPHEHHSEHHHPHAHPEVQ
jgi:pyridinium-3,5-bisthiocarboxylic acid mononucleotide nickel chelatase